MAATGMNEKVTCFVNPNTWSLTCDSKNTAIKDRDAFDGAMRRLLASVENVAQALQSSIHPYDTAAYQKAQGMADALATLLRNAGGTMRTVASGREGYERWTENVSKVMNYMGIDTSRDFTVNGMRYSKNSSGWFESSANSEAREAYERLNANNRTYEFADEKTRKQIAYISNYYLETAPEGVREAWQQALEETGVNPFQVEHQSTLTKLAEEQDFLTGGDDNILGDTKESCLEAVKRILERIDHPIGTPTENRTEFLRQEKEFYTNLASKLAAL